VRTEQDLKAIATAALRGEVVFGSKLAPEAMLVAFPSLLDVTLRQTFEWENQGVEDLFQFRSQGHDGVFESYETLTREEITVIRQLTGPVPSEAMEKAHSRRHGRHHRRRHSFSPKGDNNGSSTADRPAGG